MYVSITNFNIDPDVGLNNERIDEVIAVTRDHPGWLGAFVFRDPEDPGSLTRFTYWRTLEDRDALYETPGAQSIGLTEAPQGRQVLELVRADRPNDPSAVAPAPTTS